MFGGISIALICTLAVAGASINCTIPDIPPEGCGVCYNYTVEETITGYEEVPTGNVVADLEGCQDYLDVVFPGTPASEPLCIALGQTMLETELVPIVTKVCTVGPVPLYEKCINTTERVFIIASPLLNNTYPSNIICYWNIPEPVSGQDTGIYLSLTARDIHQLSSVDCDDKLMIHSDAWEEDLVTCGMSQGLPAMINNDVLQNGVETYFVSNASDEGAGFELLVVYIDPAVSKRDVIFPGTSTHTVDIWGPRQDTAAAARGCKCRNLTTPITTMCSTASLQANPYYSKYLDIVSTIQNAEYGFNGYKGCPGADFFRCGSTTSVTSLTEEECQSFRLGMTPQEAETFLQLGESLWTVSMPDDTCSDTTATRPDPHELVQLHHMVYSPDRAARAEECAASGNVIVSTVANHILDENNISYLRPE